MAAKLTQKALSALSHVELRYVAQSMGLSVRESYKMKPDKYKAWIVNSTYGNGKLHIEGDPELFLAVDLDNEVAKKKFRSVEAREYVKSWQAVVEDNLLPPKERSGLKPMEWPPSVHTIPPDEDEPAEEEPEEEQAEDTGEPSPKRKLTLGNGKKAKIRMKKFKPKSSGGTSTRRVRSGAKVSKPSEKTEEPPMDTDESGASESGDAGGASYEQLKGEFSSVRKHIDEVLDKVKTVDQKVEAGAGGDSAEILENLGSRMDRLDNALLFLLNTLFERIGLDDEGDLEIHEDGLLFETIDDVPDLSGGDEE